MIECGIISCKWNKPYDRKYGYCCYTELEKRNIVLKFRLAADVGKGTVVMVECLSMELPEDRDAA